MYSILAGILIGAISKYLDDAPLTNLNILLIFLSLPLWYLYLSDFLLIGLALLLAVLMAEKIDTITLSLYYVIAVIALFAVLLTTDQSGFRLAPFLIYLIALYYDEKEIKILGMERVLIYLGILISSIIAIYLHVTTGLDLQPYLKDLIGIISFDIGYIITSRFITQKI